MPRSLHFQNLESRELFAVHLMSPLVLTLPANAAEAYQYAVASSTAEAHLVGDVDDDGAVDFVDFLQTDAIDSVLAHESDFLSCEQMPKMADRIRHSQIIARDEG